LKLALDPSSSDHPHRTCRRQRGARLWSSDVSSAATRQAIAACDGDARAALKAMIVANEFPESEVCELMQAVSQAYVRGRFKTYNG
jgi:hypothetical protein